MTPILAFYYGSHPDDQGRFLAEIVRQDDLWLEVTHDYIQWIFPLKEYSRVNVSAPVVGRAEIEAFRTDALLRAHMRVAFERMLRFYGLELSNNVIVKATNWDDRKTNWFTEPTHNNLRITRILKSLTLLGQQEDARWFLAILEDLAAREPDCGVPADSMVFWRNAVAPVALSSKARR